MQPRASLFALLLFIPLLSACVTTSGSVSGKGASASSPSTIGIDVGETSSFRAMVPARELEREADKEYQTLIQKAKKQNALVTDTAQGQRVVAIARRVIAFAPRFNAEAQNWKWEVNLIRDDAVNAFCMPGGKIAFFTGLTESLKLTDDEIAIVMGHEAAHALREHARAQIGKSMATSVGASLLGQFLGGGKYTEVFKYGSSLLTLKFSRDDESEADLVGLDLAARAGFNPRAGITLWEKMAAAGGGMPITWLSTHPSSANRIHEIDAALPKVMPLYEEAGRKE
ncbi:MAG: M48 family metallopeptidase [Betaproteobacteria bacterium]|nr:M48 family metallopeptidase [Betaproteobacteria bacterium]